MPELPEVETVKRSLNRLVKGKKIQKVTVHYPSMIEDVKLFKTVMEGAFLHNVERYGKFLVFHLGRYVLIGHLRMEGKYFIKHPTDPLDKHEHVEFHLDDDTVLRYHDVRKFGTFAIRLKDTFLQEPPLNKLGPEPLGDQVNGARLKKRLKQSTRFIKSALLDQNVISGLGNIYVDETLFCAGVHPETITYTLSDQALETIACCAQDVLTKAIMLGGSSIRSYTDSLGIHGRFQQELKVHMQEGKPCKYCNHPIDKIKVGGRGTYVCTHCQAKRL